MTCGIVDYFISNPIVHIDRSLWMSKGDPVLLSFQNLISLDTSFQGFVHINQRALFVLVLKVTVLSISRDLTI
jgi:hypothetical protein